MNIIGISAYYHDSACALLQDGNLIFAAEEERFTRVKHDKRIPIHAFQSCLKSGGISIAELDCIAYYENPTMKISRQLWSMLQDRSRADLSTCVGLDKTQVERDIRTLLGFEGEIRYYSHHLSHAASSYYFSGFEDAAILIADGVGEWATTSYGYGFGNHIDLFEQVNFPHSIGLLYSTITGYLGFKVNDGEYKVMGLAPYGEPKYLKELRELITLHTDGQFVLNLKYFDFIQGDKMFSPLLCDLLKHPARVPESDLTQFVKDVAKSLQVLLEEILLTKLTYLHGQRPSENLCMAGGVALNCVANSVILQQGPFKNLFIQPAAGDSGNALGAAALAHHDLTKRQSKLAKLQHVYLGPEYEDQEIEDLLRDTECEYQSFHNEAYMINYVAQQLNDGKVIGWFQGKMEFGPRSLGSRSILADPSGLHMREHINALIKMREGFRPFAPAVLYSEMNKHFSLDHESPYMLETCQVISSLDLPAITHVDGSARVQTVSEQSNIRFFKLLTEFHKMTGCPILLNTSFNIRSEPIVNNPIDAMLCFIRSNLDILVLGTMVIHRKNLPQKWIEWFAKTSVKKSLISHDVYSFI